MKALSIRQPWAWAIIHAGKDIENRSWGTSYRGPMLIHAAKGLTRPEYNDFVDTYRALIREMPHIPEPPRFDELPRGGIVGRVRMIDCVLASASPWFFGKFGFVLADPTPLPFRPVRGMLGFFDPVDPDASPKGEPDLFGDAR